MTELADHDSPHDDLLKRYGFAVGMTALALGLSLLLKDYLEHADFLFFSAAVVLTALYGGFGPAMVATVLGVIAADWFILEEGHRLHLTEPMDLIPLGTFAFLSVIIGTAATLLREARRHSEEANIRMRDVLAEHGRMADTQRLLVEAGRLFNASLDYASILHNAVELAVPTFGDWCVLYLIADHGLIRRLAVASTEPWRRELLEEMERRAPIRRDTPGVIADVVSNGNTVFMPVIGEAELNTMAANPQHLEMLQKINYGSLITVPLRARTEVLGAILFARATERRAYARDDIVLAEQLADRIALAVDNARLYLGAISANESKSAFLATMSHELRTPLTAIIGYEELLADGITGPITDSQRQQLSRIKASAMHLLVLIEEVLTFARLEAQREVVRPIAGRLTEIVEEALVLVSPQAEEKGLALTTHVVGDDVVMSTDVRKIVQILVNLLSNAVKFTTNGEVELTAQAGVDEVAFVVRDTGLGIRHEHLAHIFEPFWQVEQQDTRRVGGTGLGLSVSQRLAHLLGGAITVQSDAGRGSTFTLRVPRESIGGPAEDESRSHQPLTAATGTRI